MGAPRLIVMDTLKAVQKLSAKIEMLMARCMKGIGSVNMVIVTAVEGLEAQILITHFAGLCAH